MGSQVGLNGLANFFWEENSSGKHLDLPKSMVGVVVFTAAALNEVNRGLH